MKRGRTGSIGAKHQVDCAKLKQLITFAKAAGLKPDGRRRLVREAIIQARTIIDGNRLEFDPHSIERTLEATKNLTQELASLSNHVQQLYPLYLSPKSRRSARSITRMKLDLERLNTGLENMLDRLKPSGGAPKLGAIEDYVFVCACRWKQAGGNPGRRMPSFKQRMGFGQKTDTGPFSQFARLAFSVAGGVETAVTETAIRNGVRRFKNAMEKKTI